jgi:glycosyltransferase involved in cell wall biosynthesis
VGLANFGPVAVRRQLVLIHDAAPFLHPESFDPRYAAIARTVQRGLSRRATLATVSERARLDLARTLGIDARAIQLVPPAVGPPFSGGEPGTGGRGCVFVGGHDERKNLGLLLAIWPEVHERSGLVLHVVGRSTSRTLAGQGPAGGLGVVLHHDIDDAGLRELYCSAMLVLSPSRYEGFGLPLLEGMACGTPFLSTDTGAAAELAVAPDEQILPAEPTAWRGALLRWAAQDPMRLRGASVERARLRTWRASGHALVAAVAAADDAARRSERDGA